MMNDKRQLTQEQAEVYDRILEAKKELNDATASQRRGEYQKRLRDASIESAMLRHNDVFEELRRIMIAFETYEADGYRDTGTMMSCLLWSLTNLVVELYKATAGAGAKIRQIENVALDGLKGIMETVKSLDKTVKSLDKTVTLLVKSENAKSGADAPKVCGEPCELPNIPNKDIDNDFGEV